jgi:hypothetical protein
MEEPDFDELPEPLYVAEDLDPVAELSLPGRDRYPVAVRGIRIPKGSYRLRVQKGLVNREPIVPEVDANAGLITVKRAHPDSPPTQP